MLFISENFKKLSDKMSTHAHTYLKTKTQTANYDLSDAKRHVRVNRDVILMPRCMTVLFRNEANIRLPLNNKHWIKSSEETFRHTNSLWTRHSVPVYLGIYYQLHGDSRRETQANCKQIVIVIGFYLFLISETIEFSFLFYFSSFIFQIFNFQCASKQTTQTNSWKEIESIT